jgi:hypothetical protein
MKTANLAVVLSAALLVVSSLDSHAQDKARIDITGKTDGLTLQAVSAPDGVAFGNPQWYKDETKRKKNLTCQFAVGAEKWETVTIRFTTTQAGKVNLVLRGPYKGSGSDSFIYFDTITSEGDTIKNGGFEEAKNASAPKSWMMWMDRKKNLKPSYIHDSTVAQSGDKCVKVSYSARVVQTLDLKANQEVSITLSAKLAD